MVTETIWEDMLGHLRVHHPELVRGWFCQVKPAELESGILEVHTANAAQQRYLHQHCRPAFTEAAQAATGMLVSVRFTAPEGKSNAYDAAPLPLSFELEGSNFPFNSEYVFDAFVTGPCNRLAHAACVAVGDSPGKAYNPLFIHGSVGLGKSHLLQAVCHQVQNVKPELRVLYLSCETFINHFIEAVERGALHQFRYRYRGVDLLVIDDIQFLAERERSQEEFFHTFNTLYQSQRQIVLSCDSPPKNIPSLEERLVSRFNWGLVARIDSPCLETRMAIVRKKAKLRCIELPEEVVHFIASHADSNVRELEGTIIKVDAVSQQSGGVITLDLAREALGDQPDTPHRSISIHDILDVVMSHYNVRLADLQSKKRNRSIVQPRQVCMYLARELTNNSLGEIGGYFGGRDHTTVLHASRLVSRHREHDQDLNRALTHLCEQLDTRRTDGR